MPIKFEFPYFESKINEQKESARSYLAELAGMSVGEVTNNKKIHGDLNLDPQDVIAQFMANGYIRNTTSVGNANRFTVGNLLRKVK